MQVTDFFDRSARLYPERLALIDDDTGRQLTYREVEELSHWVANGLIAKNLSPNFKAASYTPNHPMITVCTLGINRAGGAYVSLNARDTVSDIIYRLNLTDTECIFYHSCFERAIAQIKLAVPKLKHFICIDQVGEYGPALEEWAATFPPKAPYLLQDPDEVVLVASTGGTTGQPKAPLMTHRAVEAMIATFHLNMPYGYNQSRVFLAAVPLSHAAGTLAKAILAAGGTVVVQEKFDPLQVLQAIEKYRITELFLPPTAIYMLLAHLQVGRFDYSSLKYFIYAAAPMSVDKLKEALAVFGPVMTQVFGQSEAPMVCTWLSPEEHLVVDDPLKSKRLWSCGRPTMLTRVEIMDDQGNLLGDHERGEIVVRGNLVMKGYYQNPEASAEASTFGWHHTGDVGYRDEDGYIYIVDRKKDLIISGGYNIYPSEIEQVIWSHPAIQDCAVIGVPDEKWGEAVKAVLKLKPGQTVNAEEIIGLCKERLGSVKAPKSVDFVEDLPLSPVGKVLKKELRARYWQGLQRTI